MNVLAGLPRGGRGAVALLVLLTVGRAAAQPLPPPALPGLLPTEPPLPGTTVGTIADPAAPSMGTPPAAAPPASTGGTADGTPLNDKWRNGLRFESADKSFSLFVGGRFQFDVVDYITTRRLRQSVPGTTALEEGVSFRRIRLDMGGTIYKNVEFYAQVDFANGFLSVPNSNQVTNATYPTDMWVTFKELPVVGNMRVGNQKPLYSFEHLTSSRFLNFLERSLGFDAFAENQNNGFMPGLTFFDNFDDKRGLWAVGVFKYTRNPFGWNVGRNEVEVNGRLTYLPVYEDDGKALVHVGVGGAYRDLDNDQTRLRSRLDARNSPSAFSSLVADTGNFFGYREQVLVPEFAAVFGPLSLQSEFYGAWVQDAFTQTAGGLPLAAQGNVFFWSWYAEAHYFLTGEHREYNKDAGVFTRVVPLKPLTWTRCGFTGCGAWQVAARYSYLNLNSKGIQGGRVNDMTLGLNWFLNPNMKAQFNYFLADRDAANPAGTGLIHGFATRLAIDF